MDDVAKVAAGASQMSRCNKCGARYVSAPAGCIHKCGACSGGRCFPEATSPKEQTMADDLRELANKAMARFNALSPDEQKAHRQMQRESFVRSMTTPCEHGVLDFEQCGECREQTMAASDEVAITQEDRLCLAAIYAGEAFGPFREPQKTALLAGQWDDGVDILAIARHRLASCTDLAARLDAAEKERDRGEQHRNDMADKIINQSVEIGALRSRLTTAEAALARAREAPSDWEVEIAAEVAWAGYKDLIPDGSDNEEYVSWLREERCQWPETGLYPDADDFRKAVRNGLAAIAAARAALTEPGKTEEGL